MRATGIGISLLLSAWMLAAVKPVQAEGHRAWFEAWLDRFERLLGRDPAAPPWLRVVDYRPGRLARARTELVGFGENTMAFRHTIARLPEGGVRVRTGIDREALAPETVRELAEMWGDLEAVELVLESDGDARWQGTLRLPETEIAGEDGSTYRLGALRYRFLLELAGDEFRLWEGALELGSLFVREADGSTVTIDGLDLAHRSRVEEWFRGNALAGDAGATLKPARMSVVDAEDDIRLATGTTRFEASSSFDRDERADLRLVLEVPVRRLENNGELLVEGGGLSFSFRLRFGTRRLLQQILAYSEERGDLPPAESLGLLDLESLLFDLFARSGTLEVALTAADGRGERLTLELDFRWPDAPDREIPDTLGDWIRSASGRLDFRYPVSALEDEDLQQLLALPLAMGFARIEEDAVVGALRLENGLLIQGAEIQPLEAWLGDLAALPLKPEGLTGETR